MSNPRCLRSVFELCRPVRVFRTQVRSPLHSRTYATKVESIDTPIGTTIAATEPASTNKSPRLETSKQSSSASSQDANPVVIAGTDTPSTSDRHIPPNVLAALKVPLKHSAPYGVPVASLQLRSYSIRNLEFFSDFALRAAFYLNLPVSGPVALPKRRERWTVPKSNFVHKKSQENFERITYKRLITVMDGDKSVVEVWLAVLRKWQFWGVGMKANVWEWDGIDVGSRMDAQAKDLEAEINSKLAAFGFNKEAAKSQSVAALLKKNAVKGVGMPLTEVRAAARTAKSEI